MLILGMLVLLPACVTKPASSGSAGSAAQAAVAPTMTIERFLRAVNQNDLDTMARLFGTREGPITRTWNQKEVDDRMVLLANVLRHSDYVIGPEELVPGRRDEATQFTVNMVLGEKTVPVPFLLVRSAREPEWLIENIAIDRLTRGGE
jgi:hypothetical protein